MTFAVFYAPSSGLSLVIRVSKYSRLCSIFYFTFRVFFFWFWLCAKFCWNQTIHRWVHDTRRNDSLMPARQWIQNILAAILQLSESEAGLIQKYGFESRITSRW